MKHTTLRGFALVAALPLVLAACTDDVREPLAPSAPTFAAAPTGAEHGRGHDADPRPASIFNRYIVLFRRDVGRPHDLSRELLNRHGGVRTHVYERVLKGFAAVNLPPQALEALRRNPNVLRVEEDRPVPMSVAQSLGFAGSWGLDRMDQQTGTNGVFNHFFNGSGVHIYVLDTGIRGDHTQFTGRLGEGANEVSWDWTDPYNDEHGHGTQVAGAAAGSTFGVAKGATLHSIKINDTGDALSSDIVDGFDWIVSWGPKPGVINLSYTGFGAVNEAMQAAISEGFVVVKSANNNNMDACTDAASNQVADAIIVGAVDSNGARASFSDFGPCVDVWAPGVGIGTAHRTGPSASITVDGTSFSAPYVAGIAASMLQQAGNMSSGQVRQYIRDSAFPGVLTGLGAGSPNLLANSLHHWAVINGVSKVEPVAQTRTWTAAKMGGSGSWTFKWEASVNGGAWQVVSNGPSYTRSFQAGVLMTMNLRLSATSFGRTLVDTHQVKVEYPPETQCIIYCPENAM